MVVNHPLVRPSQFSVGYGIGGLFLRFAKEFGLNVFFQSRGECLIGKVDVPTFYSCNFDEFTQTTHLFRKYHEIC